LKSRERYGAPKIHKTLINNFIQVRSYLEKYYIVGLFYTVVALVITIPIIFL